MRAARFHHHKTDEESYYRTGPSTSLMSAIDLALFYPLDPIRKRVAREADDDDDVVVVAAALGPETKSVPEKEKPETTPCLSLCRENRSA